MALLKLFAGNNGETDREQTYGHGKKGERSRWDAWGE